MSNYYEEFSHQSWFNRLAASFTGVIFGIILFGLGLYLLFWNEGRAVQTARSLSEGKGKVISVKSQKVDSQNEGKLVHTTGTLSTQDEVVDGALGIRLENTIALFRKVEMYQWKEEKNTKTEKTLGGGENTHTSYQYKLVWSEEAINSNDFKIPQGHQNPSQMPLVSQKIYAERVKLGAFDLPQYFKEQLSKTEPLFISNEVRNQLPNDLRRRSNIIDNTLFISVDNTPIKGRDYRAGDVRISYSVIKPNIISIVAKQRNNTFEPYEANAGDNISLVFEGSKSAEEMFKQVVSDNNNLTWILRIVGYLLVSLGIGLCFKPLVTIADVIPFLGNLLGAGVGLFALVLGFAISFVTVAVAWFFYRPVLSVTLVVIGVGAYLGINALRKRK